MPKVSFDRQRFEELCEKWVQKALKKLGATTRTDAMHKLAAAIGCADPKSIENWIRGTQQPREEHWRAAAKVFGVKAEELIEQGGEQKTTTTVHREPEKV